MRLCYPCVALCRPIRRVIVRPHAPKNAFAEWMALDFLYDVVNEWLISPFRHYLVDDY
jgi:hypothetical protein